MSITVCAIIIIYCLLLLLKNNRHCLLFVFVLDVFLITPELLSDCNLKYHTPTMVLCVDNGEWQSERMN